MTNMNDIRKNILSAMAAFAVTGACVLGTVGPVQTGDIDQPVQLHSDQDDIIIVTGRIA